MVETEYRARILWAEDDAQMRGYVKRLLAREHEVIDVPDGEAALAAALEAPPDLVLSDVLMPKLDGFSLLHELRTHAHTCTIPVILMSARADEDAAVEGLEAGADDYVLKPFSDRELMARIKARLELARARKHWARQLEQANQELEHASRAKSDFLAMMSHELRTPLNAILGFSEILTDQKFGELNARQMQYTRYVHESGKHLLSLINDLLDLAKIEAGRMEVTKVPHSALALATEAVGVLQQLADAKNLSLVIDAAAGQGLSILVDPLRGKQVLYNLISNAIKFTPAGGRVSIGFARCPDGYVRTTVSDTGPGIAPDELGKLFKPFSQLHHAKKHPESGTGLGLTLTKQLVEMMGGRVSVESAPGAGASFFVDLPAQPGGPLPAQEAEATRTDGPLALVIDDDPVARELLVVTLEGAGYRVMQVATGEEALTRAREHVPDLITLDIFLPGIDGWDVLRALKGDPSTADIPVVLVTISSDREKAFGLGAFAHMVKPLDRQALLAALERRCFISPDRQIHVLAVDGDPNHLELVKAALAPHGCRVTTANTGQAALKGVLDEPVELLLIDLVLPDISGVEVIETMRRDERTRDLPVLLVSSSELSSADRERLKGAVEAVLAKQPLSTRELAKEIERAVRKRAAAR